MSVTQRGKVRTELSNVGEVLVTDTVGARREVLFGITGADGLPVLADYLPFLGGCTFSSILIPGTVVHYIAYGTVHCTLKYILRYAYTLNTKMFFKFLQGLEGFYRIDDKRHFKTS